MNDYLTIVIAVLSSSVVTAVVTAFMNRRKTDIDNEDKINQMAMRTLNELEKKYEDVRRLAAEFEQKYKDMQEENKLLILRVETLEAQLFSRGQTTLKDTKNSNLRGFG